MEIIGVWPKERRIKKKQNKLRKKFKDKRIKEKMEKLSMDLYSEKYPYFL